MRICYGLSPLWTSTMPQPRHIQHALTGNVTVSPMPQARFALRFSRWLIMKLATI
jgi:hypothetical protein